MTESTQPPSAPGFTSEDFQETVDRVEQEIQEGYLYHHVGTEPVRQTWVVTGTRCTDGQPQYAAGPEAKADGTEAYLSLPEGMGGEGMFSSDVWLADPEVKKYPADALPAPKHVPLRVWQEWGGEVSWRCSCGQQMTQKALDEDGAPLDLVCTDANEHEPDTVVERYKADLVADIRTRIAAAMTVTGADVLRYIEHGSWSAPLHSTHRECLVCGHFHLCNYVGKCFTCEQGGRCLG